MTTRPATFRKATDCAMRGFSACATALALGLMAWILYVLVREGTPALSCELLTHVSKPYGEADGGIANALLGTALITGGAAILAIPPALCREERIRYDALSLLCHHQPNGGLPTG